MLKSIITPNGLIPARWIYFIIAGWFTLFISWWTVAHPAIFPSPLDVAQAIVALFGDADFIANMIASLTVNWEALFVSALISLPLAYLCRTPIFRPLALGLSKMRFVSPAVFYALFAYAASTGHQIKVFMLALGETAFLVTTLVGVIQAIPQESYDDVAVMGMGDWKAVWYVNVRGTLHQVIEAIRDNEAMGWSMLMMVEGAVAAEGGVGLMTHYAERVQDFSKIYAIAAMVVVTGLAQDWLLGTIRRIVCPYAD